VGAAGRTLLLILEASIVAGVQRVSRTPLMLLLLLCVMVLVL
jgi:hypothetical protein